MPKIDISHVSLGQRFRKDCGDLQSLADSIAKLGLLQPIGVVPKGPTGQVELVFGERRLRACRDILGQTEIDVRLLDIGDLLEKERDENEVRKEFTVSERTAIAAAIEAEIGDRRGLNQHSDDEEWQQIAVPKGRTADVAAQKAGFGNRETYRQAKKVVETGTPELVEAMDSNVVSIKTASRLAKESPEKQREAVVEPAFLERFIAKTEAEIENSKTDGTRRQEIVNAFLAIRNTRLTAGQFTFRILPAHLEDVQSALPKVREFIAAIEGMTQDVEKKPHLKTI